MLFPAVILAVWTNCIPFARSSKYRNCGDCKRVQFDQVRNQPPRCGSEAPANFGGNMWQLWEPWSTWWKSWGVQWLVVLGPAANCEKTPVRDNRGIWGFPRFPHPNGPKGSCQSSFQVDLSSHSFLAPGYFVDRTLPLKQVYGAVPKLGNAVILLGGSSHLVSGL
jgi:hypothetical protein